MNRGTFWLILLIILGANIICASADPGVPVVPETQDFSVMTFVDNSGTMTMNSDLVWLEANTGIEELIDRDTDAGGYCLYTVSYSEDTLADNGLVSYTKQMEIDTTDKASNQYNVESERIAAFSGNPLGRMTSKESALLDGANFGFDIPYTIICPFLSGTFGNIIPSSCNVVEMGSEVDITEGVLSTDLEERHVMPANTVTLLNPFATSEYTAPIADAGIEMNYNTEVDGLEGGSAHGSAAAYINVHLQEGRDIIANSGRTEWTHLQGMDMVYSEGSTVSGEIIHFSKDMSYNSRYTGPPGRFTQEGAQI